VSVVGGGAGFRMSRQLRDTMVVRSRFGNMIVGTPPFGVRLRLSARQAAVVEDRPSGSRDRRR
jgi:hypothetical protein